MHQPTTLFIGLRYTYGGTTDPFNRFVLWLSIIAITLGVMAIVIVCSVMNGFEQELQSNILRLMPQAILSSSTGSINPHQFPKETVKLQGINRIAPLTIGDVVLQSTHSVSIGVMLGIDPMKNDPLTPYLTNIKQTDLKEGKYNVILGERLAIQLGVNCGDQIRLIVSSSNQFTPIGRLPSQRLFNVIGIFSTNSEVDNYQLLVNIQDASRLMHYSYGNITGWRLWLNEPLKVDKISQQKLPKDIRWQDWRDRKGELFQAVRMEKNMIGLLLSIIIILAAFSIITSFSLRITEKCSEIAILQTQGLKRWQIVVVFIVQGIIIGISGSLLGTILGMLLASQLNNFMPIIGSFFNDTILPVVVRPFQIISISLIAITISVVSTLYPSYRAAIIQPVEALRYE